MLFLPLSRPSNPQSRVMKPPIIIEPYWKHSAADGRTSNKDSQAEMWIYRLQCASVYRWKNGASTASYIYICFCIYFKYFYILQTHRLLQTHKVWIAVSVQLCVCAPPPECLFEYLWHSHDTITRTLRARGTRKNLWFWPGGIHTRCRLPLENVFLLVYNLFCTWTFK